MEKGQRSNEPLHITKAVMDGLEFIRNSGVTNMFDRPTALNLKREWDFGDTSEWIESIDVGTDVRLIFQGPEVIGDESLDEKPDRMDRENDVEWKGILGGRE